MEGKKYIVLSFVLLLLPAFAWSNKNYKEEIYKAYVAGDMKQWKLLLEEMDASPKMRPVSLRELVNYQYGYIGWCVGAGKNTEARKWLIKIESLLAEWEKLRTDEALVQAYKAAVIGFKIGVDNYKAPFIGYKSVEYAKKAMRLDPGEAMGFIQYGNILFFTPSIFGGDKEEAINYYRQAALKMEAKASNLKDWNYLNLLIALANAYYETGKQQEALSVLEKYMLLAPDFGWVKNDLYPKYKKKK